MPEIEEVVESLSSQLGAVVLYGKREPYLIVGVEGHSFVCGHDIHTNREFEVMTLSLNCKEEQEMAYKPFYLLTMDFNAHYHTIISWEEYLHSWCTGVLPPSQLGGMDEHGNITVGLKGHKFVNLAGDIITIGKQTEGTRMVLPFRPNPPMRFSFGHFLVR